MTINYTSNAAPDERGEAGKARFDGRAEECGLHTSGADDE